MALLVTVEYAKTKMFQEHTEVILIYIWFIIYTFTPLLYIHKTF